MSSFLPFRWQMADVRYQNNSDSQQLASNFLWILVTDGGAERDRTDDLKLAKLALSQLSYSPFQMSDDRYQIPEHQLLTSGI